MTGARFVRSRSGLVHRLSGYTNATLCGQLVYDGELFRNAPKLGRCEHCERIAKVET